SPTRNRSRHFLVLLPLCILLLAGFLPSGPASSTAPAPAWQATSQPVDGTAPLFVQTGYRVGSQAGDPFGEYFIGRGGVSTFGYPTSRPFTLLGTRVQFFQRHVMQQQGGRVGLLNLLDEGFLPYTLFGDATLPPADPGLVTAAPPPGTPNYGQAVRTFITEHVPNTWLGQPVGFLDAFLRPASELGETDPSRQMMVGLEILGFPTSRPAADPANPGFVYQRFQRGVLHFDASTGQTNPLLLADYLKAAMVGRGLPDMLRVQLAGSRFFLQYSPFQTRWLARPMELPDTDLTMAFEREDQPGPSQPPFPTAVIPTPPFFGPTAVLSTPTPVSVQPTPSLTSTPLREPPFISHTEPGSVTIGQDIIIYGRNFGIEPGHVIFTGKTTTAFVWSDTNIIVTVPQGAFDGVIRVRRADGAISNAVGFAPATSPTPSPTAGTPTITPTPTTSPTPTLSATPVRPSITALEPQQGRPDSSVLISGVGFGTTTGNVLFGNFTAPVLQWSDTAIVVLVPTQSEARTVRVRVVRVDGAINEPPVCFNVTAATPTPGAATPTPAAGC
ncbi:MAG TPA: IPT/TIG domain-containing protein, partial [Chloroflexota bacterium]|nr:IPT/TIG domain-containing protein [Chloroflexota bacterium]